VKRLVEYATDEGTVAIETEVDPADIPIERASAGGEPAKKLEKRLDAAVAGIKPAIDTIFRSFREANNPDRIEVEFGLMFASKFGAVIAAADAQATMKLRLRWDKK
jgi:hypothetical protein